MILMTSLAVVTAQQRVVRYEGGRKKAVDSTSRVDTSMSKDMQDSLSQQDSLRREAGDSLGVDTTFLQQSKLASVKGKDSLSLKPKHRGWSFTQDTIKAGSVTLLSFVPGLGQVYNRQYWKVPVVYGLIGGFVAGGLISTNSYNKYKADWERAVNLKLPQYQQDIAQAKMRNEGTVRTVFYSLAVATYLYQVADATFNYRGKVDHIRKATTLAAIFPGAGFIYTRTYWRLPIYYGGFLALATVIDYNDRSYQRYATAYNAMTDGDPTTNDEFHGRYTPDALQNIRNQYRRNRDLGIIAIVGAYILSIVDTHVIATLKNWDISPDLSMTVEPTVINNSMQRASTVPSGAGLSMKLRF